MDAYKVQIYKLNLKVPVQRLKNFSILIFLAILMAGFLFHWILPKSSPAQFLVNVIYKHKTLPLDTMAAGKAVKETQDSFFTGEILVPEKTEDFVLTGPYEPFMAGNYTLKFTIVPQCENQEIGFMDAVSRLSKSQYERKKIVAEVKGKSQTVSMDFEGDFSWNYEFRLVSSGMCAFKITKGEIVRQNLSWSLLWNSAKMKVRLK